MRSSGFAAAGQSGQWRALSHLRIETAKKAASAGGFAAVSGVWQRSPALTGRPETAYFPTTTSGVQGRCFRL